MPLYDTLLHDNLIMDENQGFAFPSRSVSGALDCENSQSKSRAAARMLAGIFRIYLSGWQLVHRMNCAIYAPPLEPPRAYENCG